MVLKLFTSLYIKILCILYNLSHNNNNVNNNNNNNSFRSQNRHSYLRHSVCCPVIPTPPTPPEYAAFSRRLGTHWKYLPFACCRSWKKGCTNILSMHLQLIILHCITSMFTVQLLNRVETIYTCLAFPQFCLRLSVCQAHVPRHCSTVPQNFIDTGFFPVHFFTQS